MKDLRCCHRDVCTSIKKKLSSEGNQFFSDQSLGVLIFFFFSPLKQLSWETAVLEIHKEAVFSHFPSLLFLQLGWLTTLIRTTPKNASLRSLLSSVSLPIPSSAAAIPSHGTSVFALVLSRVIHSVLLSLPRPPTRPQSSTSQTPQHLPPVGLRKPLPFIDFTSCPELCFFLCCALLTD